MNKKTPHLTFSTKKLLKIQIIVTSSKLNNENKTFSHQNKTS